MNILRFKSFSATLSPQMPRELPAGFVQVITLVIGVLPAIVGLAQEPGTQKWNFTTLGPVNSSPALSANGLLYVGSGDSNVYALNVQTGVQQWKFTTGGAVESSPAIGVDGSVYFGSLDNKVYCLDGATGSKKWEFVTGNDVVSSPAIGPDNTIYIGSNDRKVYALDGATGNKLWEFAASRPIKSSPTVGSFNSLFVGCSDGYLYNLNRTTGMGGGVYLSLSSQSPMFFATYMDLVPELMYIGGDDGSLHVLDPGGNVYWNFATGGKVRSTPSLALAGLACVGSDDGKVYALDAFHKVKRWEFATGGPVTSSPAVGSDNIVYVGSQDGQVYAVAGSTGNKQWSFNTGGPITSSPVVGPDGTLYIGSQDGKIYALATSSHGLVVTRWPMFRQNPDHTGVLENSSRKKWAYASPLGFSSEFAVGVDGLIVAGTGIGSVVALSRDTGMPKWETMLGWPAGSTKIGNDGSAFVGSHGMVYAMDQSNGIVKWSFGTNTDVVLAGIGLDNTVHAVGNDSTLYTLDAQSGLSIRDYKPTNGWRLISVASNHLAYFAEPSGVVHVINSQTAEQKLGFATGLTNISFIDPRPNGILYVAGDDVLALFNADTGEKRWENREPGARWREPAYGADGTLYLGGGPAGFVASFYAIDPKTGAAKWTYSCANFIRTTPVVGPDGTVYVSAWDGNLCALDPQTGIPRWGFFAPERLSSPILGADGTLYVAGLRSALYAIATDSALPARLSIESAAPGLSKVRLTLHAVVGRRYQLQRSLNLSNWANSEEPFVATSSQTDRDVDTNVEAGFWRLLEVEP